VEALEERVEHRRNSVRRGGGGVELDTNQSGQ
jgi:hypothetical protein